MKYEPASGSEIAICWILIGGCIMIGALSLVAWVTGSMAFPYTELLVCVVVIVSATARLRGWAPPPKGGFGGGGP